MRGFDRGREGESVKKREERTFFSVTSEKKGKPKVRENTKRRVGQNKRNAK